MSPGASSGPMLRSAITGCSRLPWPAPGATAFGKDAYFDLLTKAGLAGLINARQALYTGPAIEEMPALTADQKAALIGGL